MNKMNMINYLTFAFIRFFSSITCQTSKQVCYEELGCYSNAYPFYDPVLRPIETLPDSPQEIDTDFLLYSFVNQELPQELHPNKFESMRYSTLSKKFKVKIIIHGFVDDFHQTNKWIHRLIKKLLKSEPLNVILVDWTDGANDYPQAVSNTRVVGAQVAQLISSLKRSVSTPLSSIELIGRGLGAHVAAYAGQLHNGTLGRITGLSPSRLFFDGMPNAVKLDSSDAQIVDIIEDHSSERMDLRQKRTLEKSIFTPRLGR